MTGGRRSVRTKEAEEAFDEATEGVEFVDRLVEKECAGFGTFRGRVRRSQKSSTYCVPQCSAHDTLSGGMEFDFWDCGTIFELHYTGLVQIQR